MSVPAGIRTRDHRIILPQDAVREDEHRCPLCARILGLYWNFRHEPEFRHQRVSVQCDPEALARECACRLLTQACNDNAAGGQALSIVTPCAVCDTAFEALLAPGSFSGATYKSMVGPVVCDVVGLRAGFPALVIELVSERQAVRPPVTDPGMHWIVLNIDDVVHDPTRWRPLKANLKPMRCPTCRGPAGTSEDTSLVKHDVERGPTPLV